MDSAGRVDVSLERAERKVVVLAKDRRFLGKLGEAVRSELEEDSKVRVLFLEPEELVAWFEEGRKLPLKRHN